MDDPVGMERSLERLDWLRRLAEELVGDPALASDLATDAARVLQRRGPDRVTDARGFLGGVLRNLVRRHRRGERRRSQREAGAARPEGLPSAAELAGQLELQRRLLATVSQLGPKARSTVLLRYYHGLSSAEIARREGVAPATVRKRLERALEELRRRLDPSLHAGIGLLLRPPGGAEAVGPSAATLATGLTMSTSLKTGLAAALVLAASFLTLRGLQDAEPVEPPADPAVAEAPPESLPTPASAPGAGVSQAPAEGLRSRLDPAAARGEPSSSPAPFRLRLVESDGSPGAGTRIFLVPTEGPVEEHSTGPEGWLELESSGATVDLVVERSQAFAAQRRFVLEPQETRWELPAGAILGGTLLVDGAAPEEPIPLFLRSDRPLLGPGLRERLATHASFELDARGRSGPGGAFAFDGLPPDWSGTLVLPARFRRIHADFDLLDEDRPHFDRPGIGHVIELKSAPFLRGRVVESDGETPVPRARCGGRFQWRDGGHVWFRFDADREGRFEVALREQDPPVAILTLAHEDGTLSTEVTLSVEDLAAKELGDLTLDPERGVEVRAVDRAGAPIAGAVAGWNELISLPTDELGLTRLHGVSSQAESIEVAAPGYALVEVDLPPDPTRTVEAVLDGIGLLALDLRYPSGEPLAGFRVEVQVEGDPAVGGWVSEQTLLQTGLAGSTNYYYRTESGGVRVGCTTDEHGSLELHLRPGVHYTLMLKDPAGAVAHRQELPPVAPGERQRTEIVVPVEMVPVHGRVVDADGQPLVGASVEILTEGNVQIGRRSDADGAFRFDGVVGGSLRVRISMLGFLSRTIEPPDDGAVFEVQLQAGNEVALLILDPSGDVAESEDLSVVAYDRARRQSWPARRDHGERWLLSDLADVPLVLVVRHNGVQTEFDLDPAVPRRTLQLP